MESHGKLELRVVRKLLQKWKQGQNKMQTSYVRKYPKDRDDFLTIFETGSSVNFRSWKTEKSHGKGHGKSWNLKNS